MTNGKTNPVILCYPHMGRGRREASPKGYRCAYALVQVPLWYGGNPDLIQNPKNNSNQL